MEHAQANANEALEAERAALQDEQTALQAEGDAFAIEASALRHKVEAASQAERVASTQAAELRRLVSQLESQLVELAKQRDTALRSEEHTSELQSLMRISYAVFCLKKK